MQTHGGPCQITHGIKSTWMRLSSQTPRLWELVSLCVTMKVRCWQLWASAFHYHWEHLKLKSKPWKKQFTLPEILDYKMLFSRPTHQLSQVLSPIHPQHQLLLRTSLRGTHHSLQDFRRTQILHDRRHGNITAHTLAHHAKGIDTFVTWLEKPHRVLNPLCFRMLCIFPLLKKIPVFLIKKIYI